jgi:hypothetical protein
MEPCAHAATRWQVLHGLMVLMTLKSSNLEESRIRSGSFGLRCGPPGGGPDRTRKPCRGRPCSREKGDDPCIAGRSLPMRTKLGGSIAPTGDRPGDCQRVIGWEDWGCADRSGKLSPVLRHRCRYVPAVRFVIARAGDSGLYRDSLASSLLVRRLGRSAYKPQLPS